ncbi:MAG TPA: toll/interleukin-1 receptor domain-containing protein [Bacteroidia bacterium]|nr:toll/interleukin-1 receptor domain-containing protein [Bacteroidia bacterium]
MKTLWITYSWDDNKTGDVEFIAQEIEKVGLHVKLDRWNIQAGKRLWEQIDKFITSENECDAWAIVATQNSLGSESCKEEVAYALDRALNTRGQIFPILGIFPSTVDKDIIPSAIKTRLYVSLKDPDWVERITSALENKSPNIQKPNLEPYTVETRKTVDGRNAIEVRPRAGTWAPFFFGIPLSEKARVNATILKGPKGTVPTRGILTNYGELQSTDKSWWIIYADDEATPTVSYYLLCTELPTRICFGVADGQPQYVVTIKQTVPIK